MRFYIVDSAGLPAVIEVSARDELPKRLLMGAELAVNLTSGMTVRKAPQTRYSMPADISHIPKARLILGQTHIGIDMNGDNALVWRLGYEASNGFSVPPKSSLINYRLRPDLTQPSSIHELPTYGQTNARATGRNNESIEECTS